jgi:hypothetical protein
MPDTMDTEPARVFVSRTVPVAHTLRHAERAVKRGAAIAVWYRPSDGMVTYVWRESDGRVRRRAQGRKALRLV